MAISFIGSNEQDFAAALSLTFTLPSHIGGDLLLCFVKQSENTGQQLWDDDGGGGNGWELLSQNRTTGGRDMESAIFYKVATSSAEPNPTFTWNTGGTAEPMSGTLAVYRGCDLVNPIQTFGFRSATNDCNPPNPSVTIDTVGSTIVVFHGATHDDISSVGAPTGFSLRGFVYGGSAGHSRDHRDLFSADKINHLGSGNYTPPDWTHGASNNTPEYHTYTLVLSEPIPIGIFNFNTNKQFEWGDINIPITGFGFNNPQSTGKVEIWSDPVGTIKEIQTVNTWTDTLIQIDSAQGSLGNNIIVYLVVTNSDSDVSPPLILSVGLTPYHSAVRALQPDHYWTFDGVDSDVGITGPIRDFNVAVVGTQSYPNEPICEDSSSALLLNSLTSARETSQSPNMNITISAKERTLSMWIELGSVQKSLSCLWKEGGSVQNLAFLLGVGNRLVAQLADNAGSRDNVQAYSSFLLALKRPYHITMQYSHLSTIKEHRLLIDGKLQPVTDGNPMTKGIFDTHSGSNCLGNPDNNLEMGTININFAGQLDCKYAAFNTWSDNSQNATAGYLDRDSEIRDVLFRRGAIPKYTIASGTEEDMQLDLNTQLSNSEVEDFPLGVRVSEPASGLIDLELTADNVTFNSKTSEHLEWRGKGTLTWVLVNGSEIDTGKIFSTRGGSVLIKRDVTLTVTVKDIDTLAVVSDARVRLFSGTEGGDLEPGIVLLEGLTDSFGVLTTNLRYTNPQSVSGWVRRATEGTLYKTSSVSSTILESGLEITVFMINDE